MKVSLDPAAVYSRLEQVSQLADLRPEHRLDGKLDMSPQGVLARLRMASELRDLCNALAEAGAATITADSTGEDR
ncbi:MAG: hypothetical protein HC927_13490 [Deltaproteobacteria bacterium]|nr:hypothetical protein [Deltaproteobacteria bacterium]